MFCLLVVASEIGLLQHILCYLLTACRVRWVPGTVWTWLATLEVKVQQSTTAGVPCEQLAKPYMRELSPPRFEDSLFSIRLYIGEKRVVIHLELNSEPSVCTHSFHINTLPAVICNFYAVLCE